MSLKEPSPDVITVWNKIFSDFQSISPSWDPPSLSERVGSTKGQEN